MSHYDREAIFPFCPTPGVAWGQKIVKTVHVHMYSKLYRMLHCSMREVFKSILIGLSETLENYS